MIPVFLLALVLLAEAKIEVNRLPPLPDIETAKVPKPPKFGRIVRGKEARRNQFPYQVALFGSINDDQFLCGGSLISENYVLTAAHCCANVTSFKLLFGAHNLADDNEKGRVEMDVLGSAAIIHPDYDSENIQFDIALIRLPQPVPIDGKAIKTIDLVSRSLANQTFEKQTAVVAGWGKATSSEPFSYKLMFGRFVVLSNEECSRYFPTILPSHICTSGWRPSTCSGDSGGPMTIRTPQGLQQIGIVSFGFILCSVGYPAAFERVSSHLDWIQSNSDVITSLPIEN